jgi:4-hydroxy-tetrahydrodipicolinate synthase
MLMSGLNGLLAALVTPFSADGESVDESALRKLVEHTVASGVHGLVPCGSTGEFASMTNAERRQVVEIVVNQVAGRVPVLAHTAAMTTREAVSLSRHAEQVGAAGVMVVAPYYEPLTVEEIKTYYRDIAESVSIDIMIYNLPGATGVNLPPEDIAELASSHSTIRYIKDSSANFSQAARLIHEYGDLVSTFVGWDTLYFAALVEGASGSVHGAGNLVPAELVSIYDSVRAGDVEAARRVWNRVFPIMQFLVSGGYVTGVKAALEFLGLPAGPPRAPIERLGGARAAELKEILEKVRPYPGGA